MVSDETKDVLKKQLSTIAKKAKEPTVSRIQLAIFIGIVVWIITSNSNLFAGTILSICVSVISYFFIMALRTRIGSSYNDLVKSFFSVLSNGATSDSKVSKMENILILSASWLGDHYEKELDKLIEHVKDKKTLK